MECRGNANRFVKLHDAIGHMFSTRQEVETVGYGGRWEAGGGRKGQMAIE
jgi:hypothetical protein